MQDNTTIWISRALRDRIKGHKLCEDETYTNALTRILDDYEKKESENDD